MASKIRIFILSLLLLAVCQLIPQVRHAEFELLDRFDSRPPLNILFIGNSRTFYHDMPYMVRSIADSAHSSKKYEITMYAPGGYRFEDHWNDPKTQALLKQKWDYVVLQAQSNEQLDQKLTSSFHIYGRKLIECAKASGSTPLLFVTWRYGDDHEIYKREPEMKHSLYGLIQVNHAELAKETGVQLVNVGKAWESLLSRAPQLNLYDDGNHPSINGSYFSALMFYRFFSGDLKDITFKPNGVASDDAIILNDASRDF